MVFFPQRGRHEGLQFPLAAAQVAHQGVFVVSLEPLANGADKRSSGSNLELLGEVVPYLVVVELTTGVLSRAQKPAEFALPLCGRYLLLLVPPASGRERRWLPGLGNGHVRFLCEPPTPATSCRDFWL